jgi:hypothetical protein
VAAILNRGKKRKRKSSSVMAAKKVA